jgi:hypothetical protein
MCPETGKDQVSGGEVKSVGRALGRGEMAGNRMEPINL